MQAPARYNLPRLETNPNLDAARMMVQTARETCRELIALLLEENASVTKQKIAVVEEKLQHKKRLSLRMEQLLADLKKYTPDLKQDTAGKNNLLQLAKEVQYLQEVSAKNMAVLKAAHQIRADLVMTIRDVIESTQPRPQLYGANGRLQETDGLTRVVAKSV